MPYLQTPWMHIPSCKRCPKFKKKHRQRGHRSERPPVPGIAQAKLPSLVFPTGKHRAVLCQDHRVVAASNHLLGDLAVREGRHRGEGVPVRVIAQAELPPVIGTTGEHRAVL